MQVLVALVCIFAVTYAQNASPCDNTTEDYVRDPTSCNFYYQCSCTGGYRMPCPPGLEFNAKLKVCDWPCNANCSGDGQVVTPTPTPSPGGPKPPCTSVQPATLEYPGDCQKYYYCYNGYPYVVQCDKDQWFSAPQHRCINATTCPSGGNGSGGNNFKCPAEYGTYSYPGDTTRYYYCYEYVVYVVQCYKDQKYDETQKSCIPVAA